MDVLARAQALAATEVFGAIAPPALLVLAERARSRPVAVDDEVTTERDGERLALVLAEGELDDGHGRQGPGAVLGLSGVLAASAPSEAATARTPSVVLELDADEVIDLLAEHPAAARALARRLAAAIRQGR
jgi:CRP-like cAMP-binding protein